MLTQLSITGFRCFRQLDVELKPLTVLIGANDTGKSVFLDAIEILSPGEYDKLNPLDHFRGDLAQNIKTLGTLSDGQNLRLESRTSEGGDRQVGLFTGTLLISDIQRFQLPGIGVETECEGFGAKETNGLKLEANGSRVAALIDHLLRNDLTCYLNLLNELRRLVPGFEDLKIETPSANSRRIDFVIEGGFRIPAHKTSAGVRLLLFFLALVHHPNPPKIILLEEPETGIHPKRLGDVMNLLRGITQGKFSKAPAQVILTTHSPYLLDYVKPEEDQVLVFQRADDGSRTAKPVDWNRLKEDFDGFMLGEIWFNEEEAGLVKQEAS
ncbi:MAG: AAA family ATPase [Planctomycetia bacterium]|nr:AAA family ATPase [Planctomycetia bacterium]